MRRAERQAFATGVGSFATMRRAGNAVAEAIMVRWPRRRVNRVHVVCGPGNNGGDGFIAAARLRQEGWPVTLACVSQIERLMGDAARAASEWSMASAPATPSVVRELGPGSILIDALFGTGLARELKNATAQLVSAINECPANVIAVDVPSGIDADTGRVMGAAVKADTTVTFGWPKRGHLLLPGRDHTGQLLIAPVGLENARLEEGSMPARVNSPECWIGDYPLPTAIDNKYTRGNVVVAAGPMPGAARLAAAGARGVGAGMTTIVTAGTGNWDIAATTPGIVLRNGGLKAWQKLTQSNRVGAIVAGSGFDPDQFAQDTVVAALASGKPTIIDGGGLSAFAEDPSRLFARLRPDTVLTPHAGEFARLFPDLGQNSKIDRARMAAARAGAVVVLKGSDTVIAAPDGVVLVADALPPTLAAAGTGDVLAGMIAGLRGLGMSAMSAAGMGVWLHGAAAGQLGLSLRAEDLADALPEALLETLRWR